MVLYGGALATMEMIMALPGEIVTRLLLLPMVWLQLGIEPGAAGLFGTQADCKHVQNRTV